MSQDRSGGTILASIDEEGLKAIKGSWFSELNGGDGADVLHVDYEQLFEVISSSRAYGPLDARYNCAIYYCVKSVPDDRVLAVVEFVQSKKGPEVWIKVMDIYLSPTIELCEDYIESIRLRLNVFLAVLVGVFKMSSSGADIVKLYGRTDSLLLFLKGIHEEIVNVQGTIERDAGIKTEIQGRWLVFKASR